MVEVMGTMEVEVMGMEMMGDDGDDGASGGGDVGMMGTGMMEIKKMEMMMLMETMGRRQWRWR